jgi:spermidine synthase
MFCLQRPTKNKEKARNKTIEHNRKTNAPQISATYQKDNSKTKSNYQKCLIIRDPIYQKIMLKNDAKKRSKNDVKNHSKMMLKNRPKNVLKINFIFTPWVGRK